jgi:SAM-dependent methyltransferase
MTRALLARGARVDAVDASSEMLAELTRQTALRVSTTVADIRDLPMPDASYDVATAAFVLNHLPDPERALAELARVTRPGGQVLATTFGTDEPPVKAAIEQVLQAHGWSPPDWYLDAKARTMPLTATVAAFGQVAQLAGLSAHRVVSVQVGFEDMEAQAVAAYRLGMAHTAPFVNQLPEPERVQLTHDAIRAAQATAPLELTMLVLIATTE